MSSGVRVRFLGSGDAFGSGGRLQAAILLETKSFRALVDCGATALIGLKRSSLDPSTVDLILLSHLHGDHFGGVPFFLLDAQFSRRTRPLLIAGPPGTRERLARTMEALFPGSPTVERQFETRIVEMTAGTAATFGPLGVTPFEVVHASGAPAFALRLALGGRIFAYSGDTEWTEALIEVSREADLFICEAYFFEKRVPFHLDYRTLAQHRHEIRAKRLIVTHMSADMLSRLAELDIESAFDGLELEL
jgi:ribonuclease BN (tRNA processing enzyme)